MKRYDLHCHSDRSDGSQPPAEVVRAAKAAGLDGFALTDHDTTAGYETARAEGERLGVDVLLGCELSAELNSSSVHVLAYFFDPAHARWTEELQWIRDDRVVRAEGMVRRLQELGVPVTVERLHEVAAGATVGRPHVAQLLVEAGVVATTPDAFTDEWIGEGGRAYVNKRTLSPRGAVELINEAGGVAVLAHAIWVEREIGGSEALIEELAAAGMAGLEVNHPDHDEDARARYGAIANRLGLIATSSSDYHANAHGDTIGLNTCDIDVVEALRARARGARAGGGS